MVQDTQLDRLVLDDLTSIRIVRLGDLLARSASRMIERRFGIRSVELRILMRLNRAPRLSVNELSRVLEVDKGWISRSLRGLEDRGLVRRTSHPTDTRSALMQLTDAGHTLCGEMLPYSKAHNDRLLEGLDPEVVRTILDTLHVRAEELLLDNGL
jgi:DNA-binding MarR family transcriptional regulator